MVTGPRPIPVLRNVAFSGPNCLAAVLSGNVSAVSVHPIKTTVAKAIDAIKASPFLLAMRGVSIFFADAYRDSSGSGSYHIAQKRAAKPIARKFSIIACEMPRRDTTCVDHFRL
jgi:hypothetical protein